MLDEKTKIISIQNTATVLDALKQMDDSSRKLLLVFNSENKFESLISVGDLQRAIINNFPLTGQINQILRKEIFVAYEYESMDYIKKQMIDHRAECMPILDENENLIDVLFWEDVQEKAGKRIQRKLTIPVIIMAGGEGKRLRPITNILPKPLIPIGEKAILEHILDNFFEIGCKDFYISVNYKADMIKYYLSDEKFIKYNLNFFQEDNPMGTAGSLTLIKDKIHSTFFLSNCDILIDQELGTIYDFHVENNNIITIVAALKHLKIPYGTLKTKEGGLLYELTEKPEYNFMINSGLYILEPETIGEIPLNGTFHITDLINKLMGKNQRIGVFPVSEGSWMDIGNWDDYLRNINIK